MFIVIATQYELLFIKFLCQFYCCHEIVITVLGQESERPVRLNLVWLCVHRIL